jgi:hypothetical protein
MIQDICSEFAAGIFLFFTYKILYKILYIKL